MNSEQKMAKILLALREIRPFYAAVFETAARVEQNAVSTMAVTGDSLVYNSTFIEETPFPKLLYYVLHEICHLSLQHVQRMENRDPLLWNVAADLYVNRILCEEFWLHTPGGHSMAGGFEIEMPEDILFHPGIDLQKDYVEKIYASFAQQAVENGFEGGRGEGKRWDRTFSYSSGGKSGAKIEIQLSTYQKTDLLQNGKDPQTLKMQSEQLISKAMVRVDKNSRHAGSAGGRLFFLASELFSPAMNWKRLLTRYLRQMTSRDSSFRIPDKRMYWQRAIYPGQLQEEQQMLKGIKICIDTSRSISDESIGHFCGQVRQILKEFHVHAELIYWDQTVQATGFFHDMKSFQRIQQAGRGGTSPACVFQYFDNDRRSIRPEIILIFTDGCFLDGWSSPRWHRKYRHTLWVLTRDGEPDFNPPFGRMARMMDHIDSGQL